MIGARTRKKISYLFLAGILSLFWQSTSHAQLLKFDIIKSNWGMTTAGVAATIIGHELGHFAIAESEDADAYFDNFTVKYRNQDSTDRQSLRLSSAGFQSQWIISELAFAKLKQDDLSEREQALFGGLVLGHIAITAAYVLGLKDHEDGDATGIAATSNYSNDQIALAIAIPAALDAWRLLSKDPPRWTPWVSVGAKASGIAAVWIF